MRPRPHQVGDLGVNAVERLFLEKGWVVNRIHSDYGEDISVQPVTSGKVEKCRIYIQVKGVESEARQRVHLKREDLFAWQFSSEMFMLVCWNLGTGTGVYKWLNEKKAPRLYSDIDQRFVSIRLRDLHPLDERALELLKIASRDAYYEAILSDISKFIDRRRGYNENRRDPEVLAAKLAAAQIACSVLEDYGIFERSGDEFAPSPDLFSELSNIARNGIEARGEARMTYDGAFWAVMVIEHFMRKRGGGIISDPMMWNLANAVNALVTGNPRFQKLLRREVNEIRSERASVD